jgi:hypothetical protein
MDALRLFMLRYDVVHGRFVSDLFAGLTDAQLRQRPHGVNSVVWLVWHVARVQDLAVTRFVADEAQVLDAGRWNDRMGVELRDVGSGMTSPALEALEGRVDVVALRAYQTAVAERTRAIAAALAPPAWEEIVPPERVRRVVAEEEALIEAGRWVGEFWAQGHPRGFYLLQVGLLHPYGHWFDAMVTRGLLGVGDRR